MVMAIALVVGFVIGFGLASWLSASTVQLQADEIAELRRKLRVRAIFGDDVPTV